MQYNTPGFHLVLPDVPFMLDLQQLYHQFSTLTDGRKPKGKRYSLPALALMALLAKFSGHNNFQQIADWAHGHQKELAHLLNLPRARTPHSATFSRVLGDKVNCSEVETIISQHFKQQLSSQLPLRGSLTLSIDGKTLRGTIPGGQTKGVHLMAAYLPRQGVVLAQLEVGAKTNEISAAPQLLKLVDLRGVVVTGDAMQAQKELSVQIVADGGDYLWLVKANQPGLLGEIEQLFEPLQWGTGFNQPALHLEKFTQCEKSHGRLEQRTITVSSELAGYSYWPHLAQVFKLEREWVELSTEAMKRETRFGITSLPRQCAPPQRLLEIAREEWGIENGLHWVRDVTFREDERQVRRGQAPQLLAALDNIVIGTFRLSGETNVAKARRVWSFNFSRALFKAASILP